MPIPSLRRRRASWHRSQNRSYCICDHMRKDAVPWNAADDETSRHHFVLACFPDSCSLPLQTSCRWLSPF